MIIFAIIVIFLTAIALIPDNKVYCPLCNDRGLIEVIVMGTDTDYVECPYCTSERYKNARERSTASNS
jgi:uncharacterized Zn-finger protein